MSKITVLDPERGTFKSSSGKEYYIGRLEEKDWSIGLLLGQATRLLEGEIDLEYFVKNILLDYEIEIKK